MKVLGVFAHPGDELTCGWPIFQQTGIQKHSLYVSEKSELEINQLINEIQPEFVFTHNPHECKPIFDMLMNNPLIRNLLITDVGLNTKEYHYKELCRISRHNRECCLYFAKAETFWRYRLLDILTAILLPDQCIGAEIGVYKGLTTQFLAKQPHIQKIYAIDPWRYVDTYLDKDLLIQQIPQNDSLGPAYLATNWDELYSETAQVLQKYKNIEILRQTSIDASHAFKDHTLDFVFIDADHSYSAVKQDLELWFPKIKPGGIIAGHDYVQIGTDEVQRAVHTFFQTHNQYCLPTINPDALVNQDDDLMWWRQLKPLNYQIDYRRFIPTEPYND